MTRKRIKCYECEGTDCILNNLSICHNATQCYKMTIRDSNGRKRGVRGCITNEEQVPFYCATRSYLKSNNNGGGQFYAKCCDENFCNAGYFDILTDPNPKVSGIDYTKIFTILGKTELRPRNAFQVLSMVFFLIIMLRFFYFSIYSPCKKRSSKSKNFVSLSQSSKNCDSGTEQSSLTDSTDVSNSNSTSNCSLHYEYEIQNRRSSNEVNRSKSPSTSSSSPLSSNSSSQSSSTRNQDYPVSSNSDSTELSLRTLARQIALRECLSRPDNSGSFGREVWRGIWHGETVAIKIYGTKGRQIWSRETEVCSLLLPKRHDNILGYIGSDMIQLGGRPRHWIVTQYQSKGSLKNYLTRLNQPLNHQELFEICMSLANGLLYLHTEIVGTQGKPSLAHCNITSSSVLVKENGGCVIAELGYALSQDKLNDGEIDVQIGCKRYMSPERLDGTINAKRLENFFAADVYSLGLLFWEVCRKCSNADIALDYVAPYSEWLDAAERKPGLEVMKRLVVDEQRRPTIPDAWQYDSVLVNMSTMIRECWYEKPGARLTSFRVKKNIKRLASLLPNVNLIDD